MSKAIEHYLACFEPFYKTYIPFDLLLRGLFKYSQVIPDFAEELQRGLKKNEAVAKLIETWLSKCGNAYHLILTEDVTIRLFSGRTTGRSCRRRWTL